MKKTAIRHSLRRRSPSDRPGRSTVRVAALSSDEMKKAAVSAVAALVVSLNVAAPASSATYFSEKIKEDEALIDSAQAKLDAALALQLNKTKAEAVGKKQDISRRASALTNQLESKLSQDTAALNAVKAKADTDKDAARVKAELEKEVTTIINVESKLIKEVKKAEDEVAKEQLLQQARIVAEKQRKDKAAAEVKQKLETIAATAPVQVNSASEKAEADAVTNAVDKWVAQFEKLGL